MDVLISDFTGSYVGGELRDLTTTSTNSSMLLNFKSDEFGTEQGFVLRFNAGKSNMAYNLNLCHFDLCTKIIENYAIYLRYIVAPYRCCEQLIVTSSGATHSYQSAVLGTYRKDGFSNGRYSYKNDNGEDRHLHFTPNNFWMVRKKYTTAYLLEMKMIFVVFLYKYSVSINEVTLGQPLSSCC